MPFWFSVFCILVLRTLKGTFVDVAVIIRVIIIVLITLVMTAISNYALGPGGCWRFSLTERERERACSQTVVVISTASPFVISTALNTTLTTIQTKKKRSYETALWSMCDVDILN